MKVAFLTTDSRAPYGKYDATTPDFGTAPQALLQGFARMPEVEIHVVSCAHRALQSPRQLAPNIYFHSLRVPKIGWMRTGYAGCIRATRKKLREIQPDIVHGQGTERDCSISAVFSGFPNVLTIHGNMRSVARVNRAKPFSFQWLAAKLEGFTLPRTDGIVCVSNYTRRSVERLARKTWLIPNAVNAEFFAVNSQSDLEPEAVGLCVGSICYYKNQNNFIRALDSLAARLKFKMIFLGQTGKNEYGLEFEKLVRERPWCEYAGWAEREQLKLYLSRASFLALPTVEDNCPMVVLEAMAAGVPVVASNIGGVPDLVKPNETGLLVDPGQPETFGLAVARLLEDVEFARQLARQAKREAVRRFDPEVIAKQHLEIYREIVKIA